MNDSEVWRMVVDNEPQDAYTNMAVDEALLEGQIRGGIPPTVRFYSWQPPAISLGYAQEIETIDLASCQRSGIDVVRRITGGRAILHDGDLTYSIAARDDNPVMQGTLMDTYRKISQALLAGVQKLGVQAAFSSPGDKNDIDHGASCFSSSSRYELTVSGKKLIGSAQRRSQGAVLQQGSLPLQDCSEKLFSLLRFPDPEQRSMAHARYREKATALSEVLNHPMAFSEVAAAFLDGMAGIFQVRLVPGYLQSDEIALVEKLRSSKYASPHWSMFGERKRRRNAPISK